MASSSQRTSTAATADRYANGCPFAQQITMDSISTRENGEQGSIAELSNVPAAARHAGTRSPAPQYKAAWTA